MAAIPPSPDSAPTSVLPPPSFATPPQTSTPPPSSQTTTPIAQPNASPPNPSSSLAQSPLPSSPPSSNSSDPTPASPPPADSTPPPTPSAPPPSPPPAPIVTTPPASPPSAPEVSPPPPLPPSATINPPVTSPPPAKASPPLPPPTPPPGSPPSSPFAIPPSSSSPQPSSSSPPPVSPPTPPSSNPPSHPPTPPPSSSSPTSSPPPPASDPPEISPSPPSSRPPQNSPHPRSSNPPRASPSPLASQAPQSPPPPPAARPPSGSSPSSSSGPPPPDSRSASPPSVTPVTPPPVSHVTPSPPSPGSQTTVPSPPSVPSNRSHFDAPQSTPTAGSNGGIGSSGAVAIGVVAGVLMLGLIGLIAFWIIKRKKEGSGANGGYVIPASMASSPRSDAKLFVKTEYLASLVEASSSDTLSERGGFGHSRAWFTYQELFEATSGFSDENLLGEGGFGCVYKGILADGLVVAVKQLKVGASQGEWQFKAEVEIISRIHHRHLVSLVGYCVSDSRRLLVYDYVPNNTLHFHLHGKARPVLDWKTRVKIAAGAARGIAYLHEDCHPRIIHRDIKSSNILLDNNFEAQVSDFGLAKLARDADTHVSTRVMGTFGYLAPEYATTGKLTEKSDVYSFGVVLLELITGRRPVDESQLGDESLVEWARPLLTHAIDTGEFGGLVDPQLENNYIESEIFRMIEVAAACVRHSASKRPRMGQIVRAFDGISDSGDLSNGLRVGESQLYDSAQQSAEIRLFRRMAFGSQDISTDFFGQLTQNLGFSTQSEKNAFFSAHNRQGGNLSRQQSQDAQNLGFSGQSGQNISAGNGQSSDIPRQQSQDAQNPGLSGQSRQNSNSSAMPYLGGDISR